MSRGTLLKTLRLAAGIGGFLIFAISLWIVVEAIEEYKHAQVLQRSRSAAGPAAMTRKEPATAAGKEQAPAELPVPKPALGGEAAGRRASKESTPVPPVTVIPSEAADNSPEALPPHDFSQSTLPAAESPPGHHFDPVESEFELRFSQVPPVPVPPVLDIAPPSEEHDRLAAEPQPAEAPVPTVTADLGPEAPPPEVIPELGPAREPAQEPAQEPPVSEAAAAPDPETVIAALPAPPPPDGRIDLDPGRPADDRLPAPLPRPEVEQAAEWIDPPAAAAASASAPPEPIQEDVASTPSEPAQESAAAGSAAPLQETTASGSTEPVGEKIASAPADPVEEKAASAPAASASTDPAEETVVASAEPAQESVAAGSATPLPEAKASAPADPVEEKVASAPAEPLPETAGPAPEPSDEAPDSESSTASIGTAVDGAHAAPAETDPALSAAPYRRRYRRAGQAAAAGDAPDESVLLDGTALREYSAREFALDYLDAWSSDNDVAARSVTHFYGASVHFHGRPMSRKQLAAEKRRFMRRWPRRDYAHRADSLVAHCTDGADLCTVRAIYDYKVADRAGRRGRGTEALELRVGFAHEQPFILYENSLPLPREAESGGPAGTKAARNEAPSAIEKPPPKPVAEPSPEPPSRPKASRVRSRESGSAGEPGAKRVTAEAGAQAEAARKDRADEAARPAGPPRRPFRQRRAAPIETDASEVDLPQRLLPQWEARDF